MDSILFSGLRILKSSDLGYTWSQGFPNSLIRSIAVVNVDAMDLSLFSSDLKVLSNISSGDYGTVSILSDLSFDSRLSINVPSERS